MKEVFFYFSISSDQRHSAKDLVRPEIHSPVLVLIYRRVCEFLTSLGKSLLKIPLTARRII